MDLTIRQATANDAEAVAPLIINAIGDIAANMTAETEPDAIVQKIEAMIRGKNTRHSHRFTWVAELDGTVAGALVLYHGSAARELDQYLIDLLKTEGHERTIEPEAHLDEWYIDTVSVNPACQGQKIGTQLLSYADQLVRQAGGGKLSLNVDVDKTNAIRLYERLGFAITEPWTIIGEPFHHMVKKVG